MGDPRDGSIYSEAVGALTGSTIAGWIGRVNERGLAVAGTVVVPGYVIGDRIGAGGFGEVFSARHAVIGREVAIKILHPKYSSDPDAVARFVAEARAVGTLSHPGIVDLFEFGTLADGRQFCVMERIRGTTLRELLRDRGRLPLADALPILRGIAEAVDATHTAGIAHRDLKPDNVFVLDDGAVKLIDFGLAKLTREADAPVTQTGSIFGTPLYMSPEQCRGKAVGLATDVYSFGVLAYHVLVGEPPFSGDALELALHHLNDQPVPPSRRCAELDRRVDRVLLALLDKDPARRPRTLTPAVAALAGETALPRRRRRLRSWVAGVVMVAAAGVLAWTQQPASKPAVADECESDASLAGVWDPITRVALQLRFAAVARPDVAATWRVLAKETDTYVTSWAVLDEQACRSSDRATQPVLYAQRRACVENALLQLRGFLEAVAHEDVRDFAYVFDGRLGNVDLEACESDLAVRAEIPAPPRQHRDEIRRLITGLYRANQELNVRALREGSRGQRIDVEEILAKIDQIRDALERLGSPLVADAWGVRARYLMSWGADGDPERARAAHETIERWIEVAERVRYDAATARATLALAHHTVFAASTQDAEVALARATTAVARAGNREELARELARARARLSARKGFMAAAIDQAHLAGDDHPVELLIRAGQRTQAVTAARAVLAIATERWGAVHVRVKLARVQMYRALVNAGDARGALAELEALFPIYDQIAASFEWVSWARQHQLLLGLRLADPRTVAQAASALPFSASEWLAVAASSMFSGWLELAPYALGRARAGDATLSADERLQIDDVHAFHAWAVGDDAAATKLARRVVASPGAGNQEGAISPWLVALDDARAGRTAAARRVLAELPARATSDRVRALYALAGGLVLRELGRMRDALASFRAARELLVTLQLRGPDRGEADAWLGTTLVELGEYADAIEPLEEAVTLVIMRSDTFHYWLPGAQHALARALWETGRDRARAHLLAEAARDGFGRLGRFREPERQAVLAWLAEHPLDAYP